MQFNAPWPLDQLQNPPRVYPASGWDADAVQTLFFDGLPFRGKPTHVFAFMGVPQAPPGQTVPGIVLVHGGGGTAFADWVRLWNQRGYAAIAMDTCGHVPLGSWNDWEPHAHGGPGGWGGFAQIDWNPADQWTFHSVADALLAHSLLANQPRVDPKRIGITGVSWGGFLTCIIAGLDPRLAFASPVYGCGFIPDESAWASGGVFSSMGPANTLRWQTLWDPSSYLARAQTPMLWINGSNDFAYPIRSWQRSLQLAPGTRAASLQVGMDHSHGGPGERPRELHVFADHIAFQRPGLPAIRSKGSVFPDLAVEVESPAPIAAAQSIWTDGLDSQAANWNWRIHNLAAAGRDIRARAPAEARAAYINVTDERGCTVSGPVVGPLITA